MTRGVPVLDPKVYLVDATPVARARALFRNKNPALRSGAGGKPIVRNQVPVEQPAGDEAAAVSRIWTSVPEALMLCLPANSETYR